MMINKAGIPWISIEYRENLCRFALTDLDDAGSTLRSPTASGIDSYHHVEVFRDVLICRDVAQLGLSSELAHLQCGSHHLKKTTKSCDNRQNQSNLL